MTENEFDPYFDPNVAPKLKLPSMRPESRSDPLYIRDGCLVVHKYTDLPNICVVTGKVGDNVYVSKKMTSAPSWVLILILFSLLIGLCI